MNLLFISEVFDRFTVEEAVIKTFVTYNIDGLFEKSFFNDEDLPQGSCDADGYSPWKLIRPSCKDLIRGKHTPVFMKFVFHGDLTPFADMPEISNTKALLIIIKYENHSLTITTGSSMKEFSPDRSMEEKWDRHIKKLLASENVDFEEL